MLKIALILIGVVLIALLVLNIGEITNPGVTVRTYNDGQFGGHWSCPDGHTPLLGGDPRNEGCAWVEAQ